MYDQFLSNGWIFDRCQEGSSTFLVGLLFISPYAITLFIFWLMVRHIYHQDITQQKKRLSAFLFLLIVPIIWYILMFLIYFWAFGFCAASSRYWPMLEPAINLNDELNHLHHYQLTMPKNELELWEMFPQEISNMSNLKYSYHLDKKSDRYTLIVRPSKYNVIIFDSMLGRRYYKLSKRAFSNNFAPYYPPEEDGPWHLLPK